MKGIVIMDYVKIDIYIKQIDFDYTNLFRIRRHRSFSSMELLYAHLLSSYISVVEMNIAKIDDEINELKEQLKNKAIENLQHRFKDFELKDIDFNVTLKQASEQTAEWCIKNLSIPQLVNMGISIINSED
jgi:hypothetical protein